VITMTRQEFQQLSNYIKTHYGIYLKEEKQSLLTGRLQNVLSEHGFYNFTEYYNYLISDKTEIAATILLNKITTNHTYFMRESDHFNYFMDIVLPDLSEKVTSKDLRIWSAGCSTGEEPYTLAMIIDTFFGKEKTLWDTKILATDISGKVLDEAKKGIYSKERIAAIPNNWKLSYFCKYGKEDYILSDQIRKEVIFRKFNLMDKTFPFQRKFHVIFCRNVMIYFDAQTKSDLINKFYDSMEYGGYLFIGQSESINRDQSKFQFVKPSIYRKIRTE
jgi:chemotaxis protein methyltransferase CheR